MKLINEIIKGILGTFTNKPEGWSARKITAFWFGVLATYVHYKHMSDNNAIEFLITDVSVLLLCLSIVTAEHIIELKNGKKEVEKSE